MIRSVGAGGTSLNGLPQRKPQQPETPFPKIGKDTGRVEEQAVPQETTKLIMVGVKPKNHLTSILEETAGVMRLNADGDKLEVSKMAIKMAKELYV